MEKNDVVNTINYLRKYRTETDRIEAKTAMVVFQRNVMILFQVFQINMAE